MVQTVMGGMMAGSAPEVWVVDDDRSVRFVLATALRLVLSELQKDAKEGSGDELAVLRRERKRRREAESAYREAGREDLAETEAYEAAAIEAYLPAELSDDELIARLEAWSPPAPRYESGVLAKYARLVSSASDGAVTRSGGLGVMRQFIGKVRDDTTVRDLLVSVAPDAVTMAAPVSRRG